MIAHFFYGEMWGERGQERGVLLLSSPRAREDILCMLTNREISELIEDCRKNGEVSSRFLKAAERVAMEYLGQSQNAIEISQNVLIKVSRSWKRIDADKNIIAYITQIAKNAKKDYLRRFNSRHQKIIYECEIEDRFGRRQSVEELAARDFCTSYR